MLLVNANAIIICHIVVRKMQVCNWCWLLIVILNWRKSFTYSIISESVCVCVCVYVCVCVCVCVVVVVVGGGGGAHKACI